MSVSFEPAHRRTKMAGRRELIPGLTACRKPSNDGKRFTYSVENNLSTTYSVTVDISLSKNVAYVASLPFERSHFRHSSSLFCFANHHDRFPGGAKTKQASVGPQATIELGTAGIVDEQSDWSLKASYSWSEAGATPSVAAPQASTPLGSKDARSMATPIRASLTSPTSSSPLVASPVPVSTPTPASQVFARDQPLHVFPSCCCYR